MTRDRAEPSIILRGRRGPVRLEGRNRPARVEVNLQLRDDERCPLNPRANIREKSPHLLGVLDRANARRSGII